MPQEGYGDDDSNNDNTHPVGLLQLPFELIQYLLPYLSLPSLAHLAAVSHLCHVLANQAYTQRLRILAYTTRGDQCGWNESKKLHRALRVEENYDRREYRSIPLGVQPQRTRVGWTRSCMPVVLEGANESIVIAKGIEMELWQGPYDLLRVNGGIDKMSSDVIAGVNQAVTTTTGKGYDDITGIGRLGKDLLLTRVSGRIQRIAIDLPTQTQPCRVREIARYDPTRGTIQSLSSRSDIFVAASSTRPLYLQHGITKPAIHSVSLYAPNAPWSAPHTFAIPTKPWSTLLTSTSLVVGHSGVNPFSIYPLSPSSLEPHPASHYTTPTPTSIYCLATPSLSAPSHYFRHDSIIFAGGYDAVVRIYDTRLATTTKAPVITLSDPFGDDACYSIATGGPTASYVCVGTARNAAVRLFDLRYTTGEEGHGKGATLFATRRERSPVYGVVMQYDRIVGVTERRGFVIDFAGNEGVAMRDEEKVGYYNHTGVKAGEFRQ